MISHLTYHVRSTEVWNRTVSLKSNFQDLWRSILYSSDGIWPSLQSRMRNLLYVLKIQTPWHITPCNEDARTLQINRSSRWRKIVKWSLLSIFDSCLVMATAQTLTIFILGISFGDSNFCVFNSFRAFRLIWVEGIIKLSTSILMHSTTFSNLKSDPKVKRPFCPFHNIKTDEVSKRDGKKPWKSRSDNIEISPLSLRRLLAKGATSVGLFSSVPLDWRTCSFFFSSSDGMK